MTHKAKISYYQSHLGHYVLAKSHIVGSDIVPKEIIKTPFITLEKDGLLTIGGGYAWDGPSGPTIPTKTFIRSSLVHDALYQLFRLGLLSIEYRKQADQMLRDLSIADGMWRIRAWNAYRGVRMFGARSAAPGSQKPREILTAP